MMMMICFSTLWLGSSMFCVCRSPDLVTNRPCRRGTVSSSSSDFSRRSVTLAFSYFLIRCSPPALPRVRSTCTGFYWVFPVFFPGLEKIGFDFGTRYRVFLDLIRIYLVLHGFTGFYRVLLGFTGFYCVILGFTWLSLGFVGFCCFFSGFGKFY